MAAAATLSTDDLAWAEEASDKDGRFVLYNVSWETYGAILKTIGESSAIRTTYLDGRLELTSPSPAHDGKKTMIARLLEIYAFATGRELQGYGSTTYRLKKKSAGLEPDECYFIDDIKKFPDLAIEVVVSRWKVSKLEVYARLGVQEVWVWHQGALRVLGLGSDGYKSIARSRLLPDVDLEELARYVRMEGPQTQVVRAYYEALTSKRQRLTTSRSRPSGPRSPARSTPRRRRP